MRKPNTDAIFELTCERMNMLASAMESEEYKYYRLTLDYLNYHFPMKFWSVERLIRFSKIQHHKILAYQPIETEIVSRVLSEIPNFKEQYLSPNIMCEMAEKIIDREYEQDWDTCRFIREEARSE